MDDKMFEKIKKNLIDGITQLDEAKTLMLAKKAVRYGVKMNDIADFLQIGMDNVGKLFEEEEYYIGDLIMAGIIFKEVMKLDENAQEGSLAANGNSRGVILIGTVNGDIHDIGKDIFIGMACVNGFHVVDLGVDVKPEVFVGKLKEIKPDILGFSGLLSNVKQEVKTTLKMINDEGLRDGVKIIVGGGLMNKEDETEDIYADAYVKNSNKGLSICLSWAENGYR